MCPIASSIIRQAAFGLALLLPALTLAQSSASFQIPRHSIHGGGVQAASASFALVGRSGQPDAAVPASSASYRLTGGVHIDASAAPQPDGLFANGFEN